MPLSSEREEDLEEERDIDVELLTDVADDLSEDELLTEDEFRSDDDELLTAEPELERPQQHVRQGLWYRLCKNRFREAS